MSRESFPNPTVFASCTKCNVPIGQGYVCSGCNCKYCPKEDLKLCLHCWKVVCSGCLMIKCNECGDDVCWSCLWMDYPTVQCILCHHAEEREKRMNGSDTTTKN